MKRESPKKVHTRHKGVARKTRGADESTPLEFDRGWQELEAQHDRLKSDWMSLAAQLGVGSKGRAPSY